MRLETRVPLICRQPLSSFHAASASDGLVSWKLKGVPQRPAGRIREVSLPRLGRVPRL